MFSYFKNAANDYFISFNINNNGVITINKPGSYFITGTSNEGNIIIDKSSVYLYLENLELSSSKNSPILVD